jgi:hypothetical protein
MPKNTPHSVLYLSLLASADSGIFKYLTVLKLSFPTFPSPPFQDISLSLRSTIHLFALTYHGLSFDSFKISASTIYISCAALIATMLLLHIPIVASFLVTGLPFTTAHLLSTNSPATPTILQTESPATQTLVYRQASPTPTLPPTITGEYFMTTKYITIDGFTNDHATKHPETITLALPTCHQTIPPDNNGYLPPGTCGAMYNYYPSFAAAIVAAVVFGALTIAHTGLAAVYKKVRINGFLRKKEDVVLRMKSNMKWILEILLGDNHGQSMGNHRVRHSSRLNTPTAKFVSSTRFPTLCPSCTSL